MDIIVENNLIVQPFLHDGNCVGVISRGLDIVDLLFVKNDENITLRLEGVKYLRVSNFCKGNIILAIYIYNSDEVPIKKLMNQFEDGLDGDMLIATLSIIRNNKLRFMVIESSYGCDIWATFSTIQIIR